MKKGVTMNKSLAILSILIIFPTTIASACTYKNIELKDGRVEARWIPCNNEKCEDYKRHKKMIENQEVVYFHDVSEDKDKKKEAPPVEASKENNSGKVYDKQEGRERDVDAINAENDAINKATGKLSDEAPVKENKKDKTKKKVPVEKKASDALKKFFGF